MSPNTDTQSFHLALDARLWEQQDNTTLRLGSVTKEPANPLFGEDRPWEVRYDNLYANVIYDSADNHYRCWYSPFLIDRATSETSLPQRSAGSYRQRLAEVHRRYGGEAREMGVCLATSEDGIRWQKPELGLLEFDGSRANNLVMRHAHGVGVLRDPRAPDDERYRMVLYDEARHGMHVSWSVDGLRWSTPLHCPQVEYPQRADPSVPIGWAGDTHNNAIWVPELQRYALITRMWRRSSRTRLVGRAESADFRTWSSSHPVFEGDGPEDQIYAMPIFAYHGLYLGLPMIFHATADTVDCELAWSPDTISWQRICPGTPLIPRGAAGSYDSGCVYAAATSVLLDEEIRLYYGGSNGPHTDWRDGSLCLARLRPHGFAGAAPAAGGQPALLTTRPVTCTAPQLILSAAAAGSLQVALLDDAGQEIAVSLPLHGDGSALPVSWEDGADLAARIGQPIRLRVTLRHATLFGFGFAELE